MKHTWTIPAFLLMAVGAAVAGEKPERLTPAEIDALPVAPDATGTSGVSTMRTTVLSGDPTKAGLYTIQIAIPPHTVIQPHRHRDDRVATVVSGRWLIGYGTERKEAAFRELLAGSFYTEPAEAAHFAGTADVAAVVRITGYGPSDTTYVDASKIPESDKR